MTEADTLIKFPERGRGILGIRGEQRWTPMRKLSDLLVIQVDTVMR